jgi:hypothetical protein
MGSNGNSYNVWVQNVRVHMQTAYNVWVQNVWVQMQTAIRDIIF